MYIVEQIGDLILVTIEDHVSDSEIKQLKEKLNELAAVSESDVVVSIYNSDTALQDDPETESEINKLLKYCDNLGLRVYSYKS